MEGDREKLSRKMKRLPVFDTLAAVCFYNCNSSAFGFTVTSDAHKMSKVVFWRLHNSQNRIQSDFTRGIVSD